MNTIHKLRIVLFRMVEPDPSGDLFWGLEVRKDVQADGGSLLNFSHVPGGISA